MSGDQDNTQTPLHEEQAEEISRSAQRKLTARKQRQRNPLYGLGMFGLVGWAVAVPTLVGIALGAWLDAEIDSARSWTLVCRLGGVTLGCFNAWYWVSRESRDD